MKTVAYVITCLLIAIPCLGQESAAKLTSSEAQEESAPQKSDRKNFVSDASYIIGTYRPAATDHSSAAIAKAANQFLKSLDAKQRKRAVHELKSPERRKWTNLPARPNAGGIRIGDLRGEQTKAACEMMAAMFSKQGYAKMCNIMLADDQLLRGGRARSGFGTENFSIVIFGTPSASEPWAFQLDGHHLGVNVSITGDQLSLSPSFIGTQPEAFQLSNKEIRPLSQESALAYKLVGSLSDDQKRKAIVRPKRAQILTGPGADGEVPQPRGVPCSTFSEEQKEILVSLISQWIKIYPPPHAEWKMKQLKSDIDKMNFVWNGPSIDRSDVSYAIQGPSLIIEFACQQLGGNPLDHLHTMYRDPTDEYAGQLDK